MLVLVWEIWEGEVTEILHPEPPMPPMLWAEGVAEGIFMVCVPVMAIVMVEWSMFAGGDVDKSR